MAEKMTLFCVRLKLRFELGLRLGLGLLQTPVPLVAVDAAAGDVGGLRSFGQWAQSVQLINIRSKQVHIGRYGSARVLSIARSAIIVLLYLTWGFLMYFIYTCIHSCSCIFHVSILRLCFRTGWHCKLSNRYALGESARGLS